MEIQYLGTAAAEGLPALFCDCETCKKARNTGGKDVRTRTQSIVDGKLLIDFPPDTYTHALSYSLRLGQVQHLLITHSHMDHFFPVELIHRHEHFGHNAKGMLHVYGNAAVEKAFYDAVLIDRFKVHPWMMQSGSSGWIRLLILWRMATISFRFLQTMISGKPV